MHSLLSKWLEKRGIKDASELDNSPMPDGSPNERQEFEKYKGMLATEPVTVESIKEFIQSQIGLIESRWDDLGIEQSRKAELIPYHTAYRIILRGIESPQSDREKAEKQLLQIIG